MKKIQFSSPVRRRGLRGLQMFGSLVALLYASWAHAATIPVSPTCSLIDAIHAANANTFTGGCPAGSGADTIVIPPRTNIVLTEIDHSEFGSPAGLPVIQSAVTIQGNGSTISRDPAAEEFDIFAVMPGADLTLKRTTVTGATSAISAFDAHLTLDKTMLSNNVVGVYARYSYLSLTESTVSGNYTGVLSYWSTSELNRTAIVRNFGNGIIQTGLIFMATNSTISHNLGDGVLQAGSLWLSNCTLSGNLGYGVNNQDRYYAYLTNSIVSGNQLGEANSTTGDEVFSGFQIDGNNIFGHDGVSGTNFPVGASDIVPAVPLASILEVPLRRNGGRTPNHALVAGSPAINAVPFGEYCPPTDQRNVTRRVGAICDIGAYELIQ